jgi:transposase
MGEPRLRLVDRSQKITETTIEELVGPDHSVRVIWDYVCALDLSPLLDSIKAREGRPGRKATDPRILLAVWMFAVCEGIGTSRVLADLCCHHNAYRWLCGAVSLNHDLLATFRSQNEAALDRFFEAHVSALLHQGLVELACVAIDGMRIRASAGSGSFRRQVSIAECQKLVAEQIQQLKRQEDEAPDTVTRRQQAAQQRHARERAERLKQASQVAAELEAKQAERARVRPKEAKERKLTEGSARASTTDPESRRMKMADGGMRPGYNTQLATAVGSRIIVDVEVTNQGCDAGLLSPRLVSVEDRYGEMPKAAAVDGSYNTHEDVELALRWGVTIYTPLKNRDRDVSKGIDPSEAKPGDGPGMRRLRKRMETEAAKEFYQQRASTAEWVHAGMRQRGLYQVTVRGCQKVRAVVLLQALVHNLWQTLRLLKTQNLSRSWTEILRLEPMAHTMRR